MNPELHTGAQLLQEQSDKRSFGMVGAFDTSTAEGTVRLTLDIRALPCEYDGESVTLDFPEQWARQIAEQLVTAAVRLEHLRVLYRFGHLTPEALTSAVNSKD